MAKRLKLVITGVTRRVVWRFNPSELPAQASGRRKREENLPLQWKPPIGLLSKYFSDCPSATGEHASCKDDTNPKICSPCSQLTLSHGREEPWPDPVPVDMVFFSKLLTTAHDKIYTQQILWSLFYREFHRSLSTHYFRHKQVGQKGHPFGFYRYQCEGICLHSKEHPVTHQMLPNSTQI